MRTNGGHGWRLLGLATVVVLAGCSSGEDEPDAATELLFSPEPTASAPATTQPTAEPDPTLEPLQNDCGGVIATADVVRIVGAPLPGETTYVVELEGGPVADGTVVPEGALDSRSLLQRFWDFLTGRDLVPDG